MSQGVLLPFYLIVDVSFSMMGDKLVAANGILPELAGALAKNPILSDKIRFGVIDFSDDAQVILPLCDLGEQQSLPALNVRGGTDYGAAFTMLRKQLEIDVSQLRADGYKVHRPAVFFLSDGEPNEDWHREFADLTTYDASTGQGFKWYPTIISLGVDGAVRDTMREIVHPKGKSKLYMMDDGADAAAAIRGMAEILISSVLASGQSVGSGGSGVILPDKSQLPAGVVEDEDWL